MNDKCRSVGAFLPEIIIRADAAVIGCGREIKSGHQECGCGYRGDHPFYSGSVPGSVYLYRSGFHSFMTQYPYSRAGIGVLFYCISVC